MLNKCILTFSKNNYSNLPISVIYRDHNGKSRDLSLTCTSDTLIKNTFSRGATFKTTVAVMDMEKSLFQFYILLKAVTN